MYIHFDLYYLAKINANNVLTKKNVIAFIVKFLPATRKIIPGNTCESKLCKQTVPLPPLTLPVK